MLLESVDAVVASGHRVALALPSAVPFVSAPEAFGAHAGVCSTSALCRTVSRPRGLTRPLGELMRGPSRAVRLVRAAEGGIDVSSMTIPSRVVLARPLRRRVAMHKVERSALRRERSLPIHPTHWSTERLVEGPQIARDVRAESGTVLVPSVVDDSPGNVAVEASLVVGPGAIGQSSGPAEAEFGRGSVRSFVFIEPAFGADGVDSVVRDRPAECAPAPVDAEVAADRLTPRRPRSGIARLMVDGPS